MAKRPTSKANSDGPEKKSLDELLQELIEQGKLRSTTDEEIEQIYLEKVIQLDAQPREPPGGGIRFSAGTSKGIFKASFEVEISAKKALVFLGLVVTTVVAYAPSLQPYLEPFLSHFR